MTLALPDATAPLCAVPWRAEPRPTNLSPCHPLTLSSGHLLVNTNFLSLPGRVQTAALEGAAQMDIELWLVLCGAGTLLLRAGLTLYATGTARAKNAAGAPLRNTCDLCVATLAFWAIGGRVAAM